MSIRFTCSCGKSLSAPDHYAGKRAKCNGCGKVVEIPFPELPADAARPAGHYSNAPSLTALADKSVKELRTALAPPPKTARDFTYLLLLLALMPLAMILFKDDQKAFEQQLEQTIVDHPELVENPIIKQLYNGGRVPHAVLLENLPGGKLSGATLSYSSKAHWLFALASAGAFLMVIVFLFPASSASLKSIFIVGLFTGTVGIFLLLAVQFLAEATRGIVVVGGLLAIPFLLLKLIGGSYDIALDPNTNFFLSAFGFTVGVGFLEEACKSIPLLWHYRASGTMGWRGACVWGLASGVGFGVSEGIFYSGDFYNGISGLSDYLIRFISCVALHAVWAGSVGIFIYQQRDIIARTTWRGWISTALGVVVASTILHGLYDTLLKKEHPAIALLIALASFTLLALQIHHMRNKEPRRLRTT